MDIDISNKISIAKVRVPSSHVKPAAKEVKVSHKNEEIARKAEEVKREAVSIKKVAMSYDNNIDRAIITVIDSGSGESVEQIPSPDSITFMKRFQQYVNETINRKV